VQVTVSQIALIPRFPVGKKISPVASVENLSKTKTLFVDIFHNFIGIC